MKTKDLLSAAELSGAEMGGYSLHLSPDEVAVGLLDSPWWVVFDQAENRLHPQKALLVDVFG